MTPTLAKPVSRVGFPMLAMRVRPCRPPAVDVRQQMNPVMCTILLFIDVSHQTEGRSISACSVKCSVFGHDQDGMWTHGSSVPCAMWHCVEKEDASSVSMRHLWAQAHIQRCLLVISNGGLIDLCLVWPFLSFFIRLNLCPGFWLAIYVLNFDWLFMSWMLIGYPCSFFFDWLSVSCILIGYLTLSWNLNDYIYVMDFYWPSLS